MAERCIKGDYIGFTFGGVHSSELGLMRVSNGSRYEQDLLPPLQDKTAQVNGRDGAVYFGSQYNTKPIKVPVAFDNMTEESFNQLKRLLQDKKPKYLWFDETPYKQWLVKAANVQNFKWVCFDESKNIERENDGDPVSTKKRIYKGEGTLEFSCFSPYAESRTLFYNEPIDDICVWTETNKRKRLRLLSKEEYNDFSWFVYQSGSLREPAIKNFLPNSITTDTDKMPKSTFCCVSYKIPSSSYLGSVQAYFDRQKINRTMRIYCYHVNKGFFEKNGDEFEPYYSNWFDYSTGYIVENSVVEQYIPETIDELFKEINNGSTAPVVLPIIMDNFGNFYLVTKKGNNYVSSANGKYYYDSNYPVTMCFRRERTISHNYNFDEWERSSKLTYNYNVLTYKPYNIFSDGEGAVLCNSGDVEVPIQIYYKKDSNEASFPGCELALCKYKYDEYQTFYENDGYLKIKPFTFKEGDYGFIIDSKLKMIKGIDENEQLTGNIYNRYIEQGDFFKLPPTPYRDIEELLYSYLNYFEYYLCDSKNPDENGVNMLPGFTKVEYKYHYI